MDVHLPSSGSWHAITSPIDKQGPDSEIFSLRIRPYSYETLQLLLMTLCAVFLVKGLLAVMTFTAEFTGNVVSLCYLCCFLHRKRSGVAIFTREFCICVLFTIEYDFSLFPIRVIHGLSGGDSQGNAGERKQRN